MFVSIVRQCNTIAGYRAKQGLLGIGSGQWTGIATGSLVSLLYFDMIGATAPITCGYV